MTRARWARLERDTRARMADIRGTYLVLPTETFERELLLDDPIRPVRLIHPGRANTDGDARARRYAAGDLALDTEAQAVQVAGGPPRRLTNLEFRLFQYLFVNAGHTLSVERLTQHVWGYAGAGDRQLLKQLVHRLRQKIEQDPAEPRYLLTVAGTGYILQTGGEA